MKKSILNIGKTLNKTEQREINGGFPLGGLNPPPQCNGSGQLEPFSQENCLLHLIWYQGRCWSCN